MQLPLRSLACLPCLRYVPTYLGEGGRVVPGATRTNERSHRPPLGACSYCRRPRPAKHVAASRCLTRYQDGLSCRVRGASGSHKGVGWASPPPRIVGAPSRWLSCDGGGVKLASVPILVAYCLASIRSLTIRPQSGWPVFLPLPSLPSLTSQSSLDKVPDTLSLCPRLVVLCLF